MYLLGHLGFTSLVGIYFNKYFKAESISHNSNLVGFWSFLLVGSMFPDIFDKPIGSIIYSTGRWLGHTLLFIIIISLIILFVFKFSSDAVIYSSAFLLGNIMHLILDQPSLGVEIPFFPLFPNPFDATGWNSFLFGIQDPFVLLTELIGMVILVSLVFIYNLDKKIKIALFLFVSAYFFLYLLLYYTWVLTV